MLDRPEIHTAATAQPNLTTGFQDDVLPTLLAWRRANIPSALLTLVDVDGSSPRPIGSQMAVAIDGAYVGQISSGCAEKAIAEEAVACLQAERNRLVRYGKGSPYLDIVLPCGSGIDVFFDATISTETLAAVVEPLSERRPASLTFDLEKLTCTAQSDNDIDLANSDVRLCAHTKRDGAQVTKYLTPQIQLLALGRGTIVGALTQMSQTLEYDVHAFAPDQETLSYATQNGARTATQLTTPGALPKHLAENTDPWTAAVLMFHDHDWEPALLEVLLKTPCFYIGAIGSRRTHSQRLEVLRDMGAEEASLERINGPVGLNIGAKSPPEIALSILAELMQKVRTSSLKI